MMYFNYLFRYIHIEDMISRIEIIEMTLTNLRICIEKSIIKAEKRAEKTAQVIEEVEAEAQAMFKGSEKIEGVAEDKDTAY